MDDERVVAVRLLSISRIVGEITVAWQDLLLWERALCDLWISLIRYFFLPFELGEMGVY